MQCSLKLMLFAKICSSNKTTYPLNMNRVFRKLNLQIAPILLFPLLITSLTGIILGLGNRLGILPTVVINALLIIHQGRFLGEKSAAYYVLILGLGVLIIGLNILIKVRDILIAKRTEPVTVNIYKIIALVLLFPLGVCVETGVAYRLGTDWFDMTSQQTAIFWSMHTGTPLTMVLGVSYTLATGFGLILLSIIGVETSLIAQTSLPQNKIVSASISDEKTSKSSLPLLDNISILRNKIRNAIIIFSLIFLVILSLSMSAILPSIIIVGAVFTFPAYFIAERLIRDWQKEKVVETKIEDLDLESESATILRAIPDSMLRMTEDGICLSYIPAKEANSFVITGEIINKHINEFLDPKIALQLIKSAQLSLKSGLTNSQRFSLLLDNGGQQYYEARISAIGMAEVLIMIRQLSDSNQLKFDSALKPSTEDTIFLLSEPELAEILEFTLEQVADSDRHHVLCCFVIDDLTIDLDAESTSDLQHNSRLSEILMYQIAAKMKFHLSSDYIARLSDSELVTLVHNCSLEQASILINKLREDLDDFSFQWQGSEYPINTSVGLLEINADSINTNDLISVVKATCNIAKQKVEVKTFW
jgi:Diguanylate cyclase, GGDEF domain